MSGGTEDWQPMSTEPDEGVNRIYAESEVGLGRLVRRLVGGHWSIDGGRAVSWVEIEGDDYFSVWFAIPPKPPEGV